MMHLSGGSESKMEGHEHADHNNNMMPNSANVTYYDLEIICPDNKILQYE